MKEEKLKYIIYTRKSQENRDRQVLSIDSQISELREFAKKEGLEIVKELQESQTAFRQGEGEKRGGTPNRQRTPL